MQENTTKSLESRNSPILDLWHSEAKTVSKKELKNFVQKESTDRKKDPGKYEKNFDKALEKQAKKPNEQTSCEKIPHGKAWVREEKNIEKDAMDLPNEGNQPSGGVVNSALPGKTEGVNNCLSDSDESLTNNEFESLEQGPFVEITEEKENTDALVLQYLSSKPDDSLNNFLGKKEASLEGVSAEALENQQENGQEKALVQPIVLSDETSVDTSSKIESSTVTDSPLETINEGISLKTNNFKQVDSWGSNGATMNKNLNFSAQEEPINIEKPKLSTETLLGKESEVLDDKGAVSSTVKGEAPKLKSSDKLPSVLIHSQLAEEKMQTTENGNAYFQSMALKEFSKQSLYSEVGAKFATSTHVEVGKQVRLSTQLNRSDMQKEGSSIKNKEGLFEITRNASTLEQAFPKNDLNNGGGNSSSLADSKASTMLQTYEAIQAKHSSASLLSNEGTTTAYAETVKGVLPAIVQQMDDLKKYKKYTLQLKVSLANGESVDCRLSLHYNTLRIKFDSMEDMFRFSVEERWHWLTSEAEKRHLHLASPEFGKQVTKEVVNKGKSLSIHQLA